MGYGSQNSVYSTFTLDGRRLIGCVDPDFVCDVAVFDMDKASYLLSFVTVDFISYK